MMNKYLVTLPLYIDYEVEADGYEGAIAEAQVLFTLDRMSSGITDFGSLFPKKANFQDGEWMAERMDDSEGLTS